MIEIKNLEIEYPDNAGCNNGVYPRWTGINAKTGQPMSGVTCRCGRGCANTDAIVRIDGKFFLMEDEDEEYS